MSKNWYLTSSSNYFSGYENDEFTQNATAAFDELLSNSPESYSVLVNGSDTKQVIIQFKDESERYLISRIGDVQLGDLLKHKNLDWLVISFPEDNKMNLTSIMKLCNSTYPIKSNKTKVLKTDSQGKPVLDKFGDPVYTYTDGATVNLPCIVESSIIAADENNQLPIPQGQLRVTLSYRDDVKVNDTFSMYNNTYKIRGIDYTKVVNGKGIITLAVEQVQSEVK
jgi:hypothetical protein